MSRLHLPILHWRSMRMLYWRWLLWKQLSVGDGTSCWAQNLTSCPMSVFQRKESGIFLCYSFLATHLQQSRSRNLDGAQYLVGVRLNKYWKAHLVGTEVIKVAKKAKFWRLLVRISGCIGNRNINVYFWMKFVFRKRPNISSLWRRKLIIATFCERVYQPKGF